MAVFKCKMCGGTIEFEEGSTVGVCDSCGTKQTLPKTNSEAIANMFNRANNLRLKAEFDRAEEIYERIVQEDDSEAEAHWGLVLCRYGIEYVEDPATHERIPTCHRTLYEPVTQDVDYLAAIDYSDSFQQSIYEKEARAIDRIQKGILEIVKKEKPFDVFICYKETDENGKRTVDSVIANDIYYQLTQEGFKVFYAAITLEDKLGQEYEPYIFAALNSAKVMLVLGTKPEYFNAVWVKNEWSRFMKLMKNDRSRLLIPCYRDMDAYDLPDEFAHLQAQDMSKLGFMQDLIRGIKKITEVNEPKTKTIVVSNSLDTNTAPLLKRAFMFLEDGEWERADELLEQALNQDPENGEAYLGKLMVDLHVTKRGKLAKMEEPFDSNSNFVRAIRFGSDDFKNELNGYITAINERLRQAEYFRKEAIYRDAVEKKNSATTEEELIAVAELFKSIPGFRIEGDSEDRSSERMAELCLEMAENSRKEVIYQRAKMQMSSSVDFNLAIELFHSIAGYKDTNDLIKLCNEKKAKKTKRISIISIIVLLSFVVLIAGISFISPLLNYKRAVEAYENGDIETAYQICWSINDEYGFTNYINVRSVCGQKLWYKLYISIWGEEIDYTDLQNQYNSTH